MICPECRGRAYVPKPRQPLMEALVSREGLTTPCPECDGTGQRPDPRAVAVPRVPIPEPWRCRCGSTNSYRDRPCGWCGRARP